MAGWAVPAGAADDRGPRDHIPPHVPSDGPRFVPGEVLVQYREGVSASTRSAVRRRVGATLEEKVVPHVELLRTPAGESVEETVEALERRPEVEIAQPNFIYSVSETIPNDPLFSDHQWPLRNTGQSIDGQSGILDADIDATDAWDTYRGSKELVLAVIDTGVDYNHPDLKNNIWTNRGETGVDAGGKDKRTNGVDDDSNGKIDDWRGWDFTSNDNNPKDDFTSINNAGGHGTHVAGTAGAVGHNSLGVAGVNWKVSIMPVRVCNVFGSCDSGHIQQGIQYARDMGADVANLSLGGSESDPLTETTIAQATDTLFAVAAGNEESNNDDPDTPTYPCNHPLANIVCVAANDNQDIYADFSNYGATTVDLAAPGLWVRSTYVDDNNNGYSDDYVWMAGTSMATPHVAGAAAFIRAMRPDLTPTEVKTRILDNTDDITDPSRPTVTNGRLNLNGAIAGLAAVLVTETGTGTSVTEEGSTDSYSVKLSRAPSSDVNVTVSPPGTIDVTSPTTLTFTPSNWSGAQTVTVRADDGLENATYEGTRYGTIKHSASSADADFNGIGVLDVVAAITDDADKAAPTIEGIPSGSLGWYLKNAAASGGVDFQIPFGQSADGAVPGNWDGVVSPHGDGLGVTQSSNGYWQWSLRNAISSGSPDLSFSFGGPKYGDRPVRGDWNDGGDDGIGVVRPLRNGRWRWLLRDTANSGSPNRVFDYGSRSAGDIPVVGDWDGDGGDDIGVVRPLSNGRLRWYLRDSPTAGSAQRTFDYGGWKYGDRPLTGDWNGDVVDGIGVTRKSSNGRWRWLLRQTADGGSANAGDFEFGSWKSKDTPVTGNWDGAGGDGIGIARP